MITASHNPKNDNGYKLYDHNGVQICPPMDQQIASLVELNQGLDSGVVDLLDECTGFLRTSPLPANLSVDSLSAVVQEYMREVINTLKPNIVRNRASTLPLVYTAMHGVGTPFVLELLDRIGIDKRTVHTVAEQCFPHNRFPTVVFPNPEEVGALSLAIKTAEKVGASVVMANDPDADRFAAAEMGKDGNWHIFSGDELGILFADFLLASRQPRPCSQNAVLFTTTAVSSRMLEALCRSTAAKGGVLYEETLTGFKWIMNRAIEKKHLYEQNKEEEKGGGSNGPPRSLTPLLCYEEALGYSIGLTVRDKDGISALGCWVELCVEQANKGESVQDRLASIRQRIGHFVTNNSYYTCGDPMAIDAMFREFRNGGDYKWTLGDFAITAIRDVASNYDSRTPDSRCALTAALRGKANACKSPPLKQCEEVEEKEEEDVVNLPHMVTLYFENGAVVTLRGSGTEPKIKWYAEMSGQQPTTTTAILQQVVAAVIKHVLQPNKYPMTAAAKCDS
eukprot:GHVS01078797.1.p1 GENE.GHVS01078797.1~~GHVS01078797.1.p1  ORF type:complete len:507 (+),score=82.42 GHVS01078797.1:519-2039(+)